MSLSHVIGRILYPGPQLELIHHVDCSLLLEDKNVLAAVSLSWLMFKDIIRWTLFW